MKKIFFTIFLIISLNGCVSRIDKRGYMFDSSDHQMLQEGVTTKERLLKIMGSPTIISDFDSDEAWIYYAEDVDNFLFFKPEIISRTVLIVRFNNTDTVEQLKKIDLSNEEMKAGFASNYTVVNSHKTSFLKSIFSNVGQISSQ
jgi:outer membrane protein assembly factor BamE (lipoprotein component of BamABCDE complex)